MFQKSLCQKMFYRSISLIRLFQDKNSCIYKLFIFRGVGSSFESMPVIKYKSAFLP